MPVKSSQRITGQSDASAEMMKQEFRKTGCFGEPQGQWMIGIIIARLNQEQEVWAVPEETKVCSRQTIAMHVAGFKDSCRQHAGWQTREISALVSNFFDSKDVRAG